jgi:hypothetical protein
MMLCQVAAGDHVQATNPLPRIVIQEAPDIVVNTTQDVADLEYAASIWNLPGPDGLVSLREAIIAANNSPGPQVIAFNIPLGDAGFSGTVFTIKPLSRLPLLVDNGTTIDGTTQTLFTGDGNPFGPEIVIDGSEAGETNGISVFMSENHVIRGLVIHSFRQAGIGFSDDPEMNYRPSNVQIAGCYIGTDETGSVAIGNGWQGIAVNGSNNLIGGPDPADGNLISGNGTLWVGCELGVGGNNTTVQHNFIGTDRTGMVALGRSDAISVTGVRSQIKHNLISGNAYNAVVIAHQNTTDNVIEGNLIGTDITGQGPLPNGTPGGGQGDGVSFVLGASNNIAVGNLIAFNHGSGVVVTHDSNGNTVSRNLILHSGRLGIDLGSDGVTPNDPGDGDAGPNNLQNYPVLTSALVTPGRLVVQGTIDSPDPASIVIELFANPVPNPGPDSSGYGEGAVYLGSVQPNPRGMFTAALPSVVVGTLITATATDAVGNTSEFAQNIEAKSRRK